MKISVLFIGLMSALTIEAQQADEFDYFSTNRTMIRNDVQAVLMCNGLLTSGWTLEQCFRTETRLPAKPGRTR